MNQTGVLVDSFEDGYQLGLIQWPTLTREQYRTMFDKNIFESIAEMGPMHCTDDELTAFKKSYMIPRREKMPIVSGMRECIENLSKTCQFAINSSGNSSVNKHWMELNGIDHYFPTVLGKSEGLSKTSKLEQLLQMYNRTPDECIYVTDKTGDALEALSVGIRVVLVSWGFQTASHLNKLLGTEGIVGMAHTPNELEQIVFETINSK